MHACVTTLADSAIHNRAVKTPNSRLVKLAKVDGVQLHNNHVLDSQENCRRSNVSALLATQSRHSCACLFQSLDVANIVHHQKHATCSALYDNDQLISLALYSLNTIFVVSRRLISRFRCGCHGLHVENGCFHSQRLIGCANQNLLRLSITFCFDCPACTQITCRCVHRQQLVSSTATIPP